MSRRSPPAEAWIDKVLRSTNEAGGALAWSDHWPGVREAEARGLVVREATGLRWPPAGRYRLTDAGLAWLARGGPR